MRRILVLAMAVSALSLAIPRPAAALDDSHGVGSVYVDHTVYGPFRAKRVHRVRHHHRHRHHAKSGGEHIRVVSFPYRYHRHTAGGYFAPWHDPRAYGEAWYWKGSSWR